MSHRVIYLVVLLMTLMCSMPSWSARMPRGSFLIQPAGSVWQLSRRIESTPISASRYEKHYGIPATQFVRYVRSQLGTRQLKSTGTYRVFHVKRDGTIGSQMRRLKKGTAVFMHLRTAQPILLVECGNPMTTSLPGYAAPAVQDTPPPVHRPYASAVSAPPAVPTLEPNLLEEPAMAPMQMADIPLWEADPMLMMPDLPVSRTSAFAYTAPTSLAPLFTVGAGGIAVALGGGSGLRGSNPPPVVPEPTSLLLWVSAGAGLILERLRRHKRSS